MRTARILVGAVCLGLVPAAAQAQWDASAHTVATGGDNVLLDASADGNYGLLVAWEVGGAVRAQRIDAIAGHRWDSLGITIADTGLASANISAGCGYGGLEGQFVAWTDVLGADTGSNADAKRIYLMRLLPDATEISLTGTLTFTNASTAVTAVSSGQFASEIRAGEFIRLDADGQWVRVESVTNDENLVLTEDYPVTGGAAPGPASLLRTYRHLTGTSTFNNASIVVTGSQTYFTTEVVAGDFIRLDSSPAAWMKVASVTDDENLVLAANALVSGSGSSSVSVPFAFKTVIDTPADHDCRNPRVLQSGNGAYVVWENYTLAMDDGTKAPLIQLSYVSEYGDVWWTTDIGNAHGTAGNIRLFPDGSDGIIIVYDHGTSPSAQPSTTRAARINTLGEDVWQGKSPYKIWYRPLNVANVAPDGQGGLWVAGRWPYADVPPVTEDPDDDQFNPLYHQLVNNGEYVIVNHLLPDGSWGLDPWIKALEWDAQEKRTRSIGTDLVSDPAFTDYTTDQQEPRLVRNGESGVYLIAEDDRQDATTNASLYGQKITDFGVLEWNEGGADSQGNAGYLVGWDSLTLAPLYDPYPWQEGCAVRVNNAAAKSDHSAHCESWIDYHPYFVEDRLLNNMTAVWREANVLMTVDLDTDGDGALSGVTTVLADMGVAATGGYKLKTIPYERFGAYMVWNNGGASGNVVAIHSNYWLMWSTSLYALGRVTAAVGPGPDVFPPVGPPTSFAAVSGPGQVELSWLLPVAGLKPLEDVYGVRIQRSMVGFPQTADEGEFIYAGPDIAFIDTDVQSNEIYYYSAFAYDTELTWPNYSAPALASVKVGFADVENLTAEGGDGSVTLSWDLPVGEGLSGMVILRSDGDDPPTRSDRILLLADTDPLNDPADVVVVDIVGATTTSYIDDDAGVSLQNGQLYYYTIFAYDDTGDPNDDANQPAYSRGASTSAVPLPPMVSLTADGGVQGNDQTIELNWVFPADPDGAVAGVVIRYDTLGAVLTPTDGTELSFFRVGDPTSYSHQNLDNGTTYFYAAFAADSETEPRNYAAPVLASEAPSDNIAPGNVTGLDADDGFEAEKVNLTWAVPGDEDGVLMLRMEQAPGDPVPTQPDPANPGTDVTEVNVDTSPYLDENLTAGTTYHYWAWAYDDAGNYSANVDYDSATPVANLAPEFDTSPADSSNTATSVLLSWSTDEATTAVVSYGLDAQTLLGATANVYTMTVELTSLSTGPGYDASVTIDNLKGGTAYVCEVTVTDSEGASATATASFSTLAFAIGVGQPDEDGDLLPNTWEVQYHTPPLLGPLALDPTDPNSDGDSLDDNDEDFDGDGLTNLQEYQFGTNPLLPDTDGDEMSDYDEIMAGRDPVTGSWPTPLGETDGGCGASGGGAPLAWALVLGAAALVVLSRRRRAALVRR